MDPALWIVTLACVWSAFFASCNNALKTFSKARLLDLLEVRGRPDRFNRLVLRADQLTLMTGVLRTLLNLLVLLGTLYFVEQRWPQLEPLWQDVVAFALAGLLVAVTTVALPVAIARHQAERILAFALPLLLVLLTLTAPLAHGLHLFDPLVRKLWGPPPVTNEEDAITQEVINVVQDHHDNGQVDPAQRQMLEGVFEMPSTTAGEIMTPRTDIRGLTISATLPQIKECILRDGYSRIPVYDGSLDHIHGILYAKDLIRYLDNSQAFDLRRMLRQAMVVPESKPLRELLAEMKNGKVHLAIVLDEYGGTAGMVTIEDIIEEVVGEIQDEYETTTDEPLITRVDDTTVDVDGRVYVHDLNDELDAELPEEEAYDTIGGFVVSTLGHIPEVGESFDFQNLRLVVTDAARTKVNRVRVQKMPEVTAGENE